MADGDGRRDEAYLRAIRESGDATIDGVELRALIAADWLVATATDLWPGPEDAPAGIRAPLLFLFGLLDDCDPLAPYRAADDDAGAVP